MIQFAFENRSQLERIKWHKFTKTENIAVDLFGSGFEHENIHSIAGFMWCFAGIKHRLPISWFAYSFYANGK